MAQPTELDPTGSFKLRYHELQAATQVALRNPEVQTRIAGELAKAYMRRHPPKETESREENMAAAIQHNRARLNKALHEGDVDSIFTWMCDHYLKKFARSALRREREHGHALLQTTDVFNECVRRLLGQQQALDASVPIEAIFSQATRNVLADNARKRNAKKRSGGWARVSFEPIWIVADTQTSIESLDLAMQDLLRWELHSSGHPKHLVALLDLKYFGSHSTVEIARMLALPERTIRHRLSQAIAKLRTQLTNRLN